MKPQSQCKKCGAINNEDVEYYGASVAVEQVITVGGSKIISIEYQKANDEFLLATCRTCGFKHLKDVLTN